MDINKLKDILREYHQFLVKNHRKIVEHFHPLCEDENHVEDTKFEFNNSCYANIYDDHNYIIRLSIKSYENIDEETLFSDLKVWKFKVTHEFLHSLGMCHSSETAKVGYFSHLINDTYTPQIMKFLGEEPPTEQDWIENTKHLITQRIKESKYVAFCKNGCGIDYKKRMCKSLKDLEGQYCSKCNGEIIIMNADINKVQKIVTIESFIHV